MAFYYDFELPIADYFSSLAITFINLNGKANRNKK